MQLEAKNQLKVLKPIGEVFEGIIDPEKMSHYFISSGSGRMEEGKTITWHWTDYATSLPIQVKHVEKDKRITYLWSATGIETRVEMELAPVSADATLVTITERGWDKDDQGIARLVQQTHGWVHFLCGLKAFLEHGINIRIGAF